MDNCEKGGKQLPPFFNLIRQGLLQEIRFLINNVPS